MSDLPVNIQNSHGAALAEPGQATNALTIYQPYASMIIEGAKAFEFRTWRPAPRHIGQRLVIHAAQKRLPPAILSQIAFDVMSRATPGISRDKAMEILQRCKSGALTYSAGLGTVILGEAVKPDGWAHFGWPMLDVEKWAQPIPCSGLQGLWKWRLQHGEAA